MVQSMLNGHSIVVLFCLFNLSRLRCSNFNISNGTIDTKYTSQISQTSTHVYEFSSLANPFQIETSVDSTNVASPVQIYVNYQTYVESWSLPIKFQLRPRDVITSSNRIACPAKQSNVTNKLTIKIQTFSMDPIQYSLRVVRIDSNMIQLGQKSSASFNPAYPTYFVMDIPNSVEIIEINLSSQSELCSLVRVTSFTCPPNFALRSSREIKGYDLTMTEAADLSVKRSDFAGGRVMILLIPLPASQCETTVEYSMNISSENYAKNTSLQITAGNKKFWEPILILTSIILVPYVMFAILIGFELLLVHRFPQTTKLFSMFSRVRRVTSRECEDNSKTVNGSDKKEYVELDISMVVAEAPSSNVAKSGENACCEMYKREIANNDISYLVRGRYYYDVISNKEINVKDLNLKSDRESKQTGILYFSLVIIIGIFYMVPAMQVSYTQLERMILTGEQDICYLNFKCDREYAVLRAFNNIWSNISYILLSILFLIITAVKNISFVRELRAQGVSTTGVPQIFGLYYGMSAALLLEGIMSAIYHICPSTINYQFDTTFIYILLTLLFIRMYKNRHPDSEVKPCVVFLLLSIIVLLTCVSLLNEDPSNYTGKVILTIGLTVVTFLVIYMVYNLFITDLLYFYYKECRKHKSTLRVLRQVFWPEYNKSRIFQSLTLLIPLFIVIVMLWTPDLFDVTASAIIYFFAAHLIVYVIYYWLQKFVKKEFFHRPIVFIFSFSLLLLSSVFWGFSFYYKANSAIAWEYSPAAARAFNGDCIFLDYFDHHDLWHVMSAFAIFTIYLSTLLVDDNLYFVQRDKIPVF